VTAATETSQIVCIAKPGCRESHKTVATNARARITEAASEGQVLPIP
jgi:hypothetical protein